jgi:hypothetical protein
MRRDGAEVEQREQRPLARHGSFNWRHREGAGGMGGAQGIVGGGAWTSEIAVLPPPPGQGTETGAGRADWTTMR